MLLSSSVLPYVLTDTEWKAEDKYEEILASLKLRNQEWLVHLKEEKELQKKKAEEARLLKIQKEKERMEKLKEQKEKMRLKREAALAAKAAKKLEGGETTDEISEVSDQKSTVDIVSEN
jgi:hypothetical protein